MFSSSRLAAPAISREYLGRKGPSSAPGETWPLVHGTLCPHCGPQVGALGSVISTDEQWVLSVCVLARKWLSRVRQPKMCHNQYLTSNLFFFPRECSRIFGEDGLTLKLFLKRTAPFSILWTLTNYLYLLALKKLTATDVSALFCCNKAFVFLLSWIVLKDRFMGVRVMAHLIQCVRTPVIVNPGHRESSSVSWNFCQTFPIGSRYKLEFEDALGHPGNYHIMKG